MIHVEVLFQIIFIMLTFLRDLGIHVHVSGGGGGILSDSACLLFSNFSLTNFQREKNMF